MDKLAKICEVLALKRSRAEREIAEHNMSLQALDRQIETIEAKISDISAEAYIGVTSDDPIGDAIMLENWRNMASDKIRALQIQKKDIGNQLTGKKQTLKEILVKEDILNSSFKAKQRAHEQERQENESSARLENWVVSQSCAL